MTAVVVVVVMIVAMVMVTVYAISERGRQVIIYAKTATGADGFRFPSARATIRG